jgi:general secretion pathway protein F
MRYRAKIITTAMTVDVLEVEASNREEAARFVAAKGGRVLGLEEIRGSLRSSTRAGKFNLAVFNQQLFSLLEAGQPIVDAIDILGRNDQRGQQRGIYDSLLQSLRQGKQLSSAMAGLPSVFPALYVAMVKSSETTGTVRDAVRRFSLYQRQSDEIRGKLKAAATYPAVLLGVAALVVGFLMLYVVPRFAAVFDDVSARHSAASGFVQTWGGFVNRHGMLAWSMVLGTVAVLVLLALNARVRALAARRLLAMPWLGEKVWLMQVARLYRTLGILMRSGIAIPAAMRMTIGALPAAMRLPMETALARVSEGRALSTVMAECGLSTPVADRLLVAGESSGNLDDMLERIADFYDQEMATWIDTTGRLVEPLLMVAIGLVIGAVVLMLYMPIFELTSAI